MLTWPDLCLCDCLGSQLLLYLPQVIIHELDATSPMVPSAQWATATRLYHYNFEFNEQESLHPESGGSTDQSVCPQSPSNTTPSFPEFCPRSSYKQRSSLDGRAAGSQYSSDLGTPPPAPKSSKSPNYPRAREGCGMYSHVPSVHLQG